MVCSIRPQCHFWPIPLSGFGHDCFGQGPPRLHVTCAALIRKEYKHVLSDVYCTARRVSWKRFWSNPGFTVMQNYSTPSLGRSHTTFEFSSWGDWFSMTRRDTRGNKEYEWNYCVRIFQMKNKRLCYLLRYIILFGIDDSTDFVWTSAERSLLSTINTGSS
jgi:hypothetical protein